MHVVLAGGRHGRAHRAGAQPRRLPASPRPRRRHHRPRHRARPRDPARARARLRPRGSSPPTPMPRRPTIDLVRLPAAGARRRSREVRDDPRRAPAPTSWSASAATSRCRPTSAPAAACRIVIHEANARPGPGEQGRRAVHAATSDAPSRKRSRARVTSAMPLRRTIADARPRGAAGRGARVVRPRPGPARRCSCSAGRRAPVGSTTPPSTPRPALTAQGIQVLHAVGLAQRRPAAHRPARPGAVRRGALPRPHGPRLRRGRRRALPRRCDDLRGARRGRAARGLRARCRSATASSGSTRCPSSTPGAGSSSTTRRSTPSGSLARAWRRSCSTSTSDARWNRRPPPTVSATRTRD